MKRIIPGLAVGREGRLLETVRFHRLERPDDPVEAAAAYADAGADELMLVGRGAPLEALVSLSSRIAPSLSIPLAVEIDLAEPQEVEQLLVAGAARVAIEVPALRDPALVALLAGAFGSGAIAVRLTASRESGSWRVVEGGAGVSTEWDAAIWASVVQTQGAGEIVVESTGRGASDEPLDLELLAAVSSAVTIPVIAAGEAEQVEDLFDALMIGNADAVLVGSLLHSGRETVGTVKSYLAEHGLETGPA